MEKFERSPKTNDSPAPGVDRAERAHRLLKALLKPGTKLRADRESVGEDLYRLLQRVEERGISKARVLREAGYGSDETDPRSHLSQYAIRPGANPGRLRETVGPYAKITRKAARLGGMDETDALLEVFGRASFWQSASTRKAASEFVDLADRLHLVMKGVARESALTEFFRNVKKGGGVLTPAVDCWSRERESGNLLTPQEIAVEFNFWSDWGPQRWPIEFYQQADEAVDGNGDHIPVYPSLVLGAWQVGSPFPVEVAAQMLDGNGDQDALVGTVDGQHEVEMRLCIVPIGNDMEATPALRVRLGTTLSPLVASCDATPILTFPWVSMPLLRHGKAKIWGRRASGNHDVNCDIEVRGDVIPPLFNDYFGDLASSVPGLSAAVSGPRFLPITGTICEDWFGFSPSRNRYDPMSQRIADRALGYALADLGRTPESPSVEFEFDTIADTIHRCLCDAAQGIDVRLKDHAELLRGIYEEALNLGLSERQQGWELVKKRWEPNTAAD